MMRMKTRLLLLSLLALGCNQPDQKPNTDSVVATKKNMDTAASGKKYVVVRRPDLVDTTFVDGNHVVFLRPDSARFASYAGDKNSVIYDADAKFGDGVSNAIDTIIHNKKFHGIRVIISTRRYVSIVDCKTCPMTVDRDTIDYGVLLTSKGKEIQLEKNNINTGEHYLQLVRDYFKVKK